MLFKKRLFILFALLLTFSLSIPFESEAHRRYKQTDYLITDFESWPNNVGGQMWVNGGGEPNWSSSTFSWIYGADTPQFDSKYVHSGKNSFRLVNAMDPRKLPWASFAIDLGPAIDITVEPRKITSFDASNYSYLIFWVRGEEGGEKFTVSFRDSSQREVTLIPHFEMIPADWKKVRLPLSAISKEVNLEKLDTIILNFGQSAGNERGTVFYVDDMVFSGKQNGEKPVSVSKQVEKNKLLLVDFEQKDFLKGKILLSGGAQPNFSNKRKFHSMLYQSQLENYSIENVFRGEGTYQLVNERPISNQQPWSSLIFDLEKILKPTDSVIKKGAIDISGYRYLLFWAKGKDGGERIKVFFKDVNAPGYHPQMLVDPYPQILKSQWQKVIVPLKNVSYQVDLTQIIQVGIEFGSWVGNLKNDVIYVDDFLFSNLLNEP